MLRTAAIASEILPESGYYCHLPRLKMLNLTKLCAYILHTYFLVKYPQTHTLYILNMNAQHIHTYATVCVLFLTCANVGMVGFTQNHVHTAGTRNAMYIYLYVHL